MTNPKKLVAAGYDRIAEGYGSWSAGAAAREYWLHELLARLAPAALILDLGCGNGMVARALCDRGHTVVAVDISSKQIELACQNAPAANLLLADMTTCPFVPGAFNAVVAFYSITHVPRREHASLLRSIAHSLKPGGLLAASMGADPTNDWIGPWLGTQMFFSHFDAQTNETLISESGFRIELAEIVEQTEVDRMVKFLWIFARRL